MVSDSRFMHASIADIPEDEFLARLLSDPLWGTEFFHLAGMPENAATLRNVLLNTAPGGLKGDIDVLRCDPVHPETAVAYQFKRIKFGISHVRNGTPSKLHEFKKVAQQANLLARMGFWQVYVYVVVVADTREQNLGKVTYAGLSNRLKSLADAAIVSTILDAKVGLVILDFTQPMDREPFTVGTHGLEVRRLATPSLQSHELTGWISKLFSGPQSGVALVQRNL
jgi:hypothetical protein